MLFYFCNRKHEYTCILLLIIAIFNKVLERIEKKPCWLVNKRNRFFG